MDILISIAPYILAVGVVFLFALARRRRPNAKFPPGPVGLPLVGHLFYFKKDTIDRLRDFHEEFGKTFYLKMGSQDVVM